MMFVLKTPQMQIYLTHAKKVKVVDYKATVDNQHPAKREHSPENRNRKSCPRVSHLGLIGQLHLRSMGLKQLNDSAVSMPPGIRAGVLLLRLLQLDTFESFS